MAKDDIDNTGDEPGVVYEDVPEEEELPCGWEDHLYDAWRDQQHERQDKAGSGIPC